MLSLLALTAAGSASGSGSQAMARVSITKLAASSPPLPELVQELEEFDFSSIQIWARSASARVTRERLPAIGNDLVTELIVVTFE